jgi:hypothetical protein
VIGRGRPIREAKGCIEREELSKRVIAALVRRNDRCTCHRITVLERLRWKLGYQLVEARRGKIDRELRARPESTAHARETPLEILALE